MHPHNIYIILFRLLIAIEHFADGSRNIIDVNCFISIHIRHQFHVLRIYISIINNLFKILTITAGPLLFRSPLHRRLSAA